MKIQATILKNQITSNSKEAHDLQNKSRLGEKTNQKISYSIYEAYYLTEQNLIQILNFQNKKISQKELLKKFSSLDKNFQTKYLVFKNLTEKGYLVKTALKFGTDFRIYSKDKKSPHSIWLCQVLDENSKISTQDFSAKNRIAHSTKKKLLIALIDNENKVTCYETNWIQP